MNTEGTVETSGKDKEMGKAANSPPVKKDTPKEGGGSGGGGGGRKGSSVAAMTRALLKKHADLDTVKPSFSTMGHVPSGSIVVNNLIGGSKAADGKGSVCPGFPRRRIAEVYGAESCGKTTLALAAIVQCQKAGGTPAFLDFEHALHDGYARQIGVSFDEDRLVYVKPDTLEQGMKAIYLCIRAGIDLIVVDSVASMVPKDEFEKKIDDPERIGSIAAPLTRNLKKLVIWLANYPDGPQYKNHAGTAVIFINQTRSKIASGGYGNDEDQTPGGKALKFFSSLRLRMTRIKSEVIKKRDPATGKDKNIPYGNVTTVKVVKTKIDLKQGQEGVIFIRYGQGLDDTYSVIENGVRFKIIRKDGSFYQFGEHRVQGREAFRKFLLDNSKVLTELQTKVTDAMFSTSVEVNSDESQSADDKLRAEIEADIGDDSVFESEEESEAEVELSEEG